MLLGRRSGREGQQNFVKMASGTCDLESPVCAWNDFDASKQGGGGVSCLQPSPSGFASVLKSLS